MAKNLVRAAVIAGVMVCTVGLACPGAHAAATEWPVYQHDNQRTSRSSSSLNPMGLQFSWSSPQGYGRPLIVGDSVIATRNSFNANVPANITSFNIFNGAVRWSLPITDAFQPQIAQADGLFAYSAETSVNGIVQSSLKVHDLATGAFKYSVPLVQGGPTTIERDTTTSQPVAYVNASGRMTAVRLGASSGQTLWSATGYNAGNSDASVLGDSLLLGSVDQFYAIDRTSGAVRQFRDGPLIGGGGPPPVVDAARNQFYAMTFTGLTAFSYDGVGGAITPLWTKSGAGIKDTVALDADGFLYSSDRDLLAKLDPTTGNVVDSEPGKYANASFQLVSNGYVWDFGGATFDIIDPAAYVHRTSDLTRIRTLINDSDLSASTYPGRSVIDDTHFIFDTAPSFIVYSVPEPSAAALVALGAASVLACRRRKLR